MASHKLLKEDFVSGLEGTSLGEVSTLTLTLAAGYLLERSAVVCLPSVQRAKEKSHLFSFLLDFCTLVLPGILIFTVLSDNVLHVLSCELALSATILLYSLATHGQSLSFTAALDFPYPNRLPFVTAGRNFINVLTAVAILAVDFTIFPRRFAKAETYGSGLMDVGVAAYLACHGLISLEARYPERFKHFPTVRGYFRVVLQTLRYVLPLLVVGLLRLAAVKSTDYQEHVSEYGVHWNFFFTIAFVRLLCTLIFPILLLLPVFPYGLLSISLVILYQCTLSLWGGRDYILFGPLGDGSRLTLISANREGLLSCAGYLSVYMGFIELGRWLMRPGRSKLRDYFPLLAQLVLLDLLLWVLTSLSVSHVEPVSRRFANLTYILWMSAYTVMILVLFLTVDLLTLPLSHLLSSPNLSPLYSTSTDSSHSKPHHLCLISALDYNQLLFFLAANVLTGLVNLSMDTLSTSPPVALLVLVVYMAVLAGGSVVLHRTGVKIKL